LLDKLIDTKFASSIKAGYEKFMSVLERIALALEKIAEKPHGN
jgi:hypothetical protein